MPCKRYFPQLKLYIYMVSDMQDVGTNQATDYLDSEPILWIKSDVFFQFLSRRLVELRNVQLHLAHLQPSNYGIMTAVILHIMRSVMVTPRITQSFLGVALRDLRFNTIMNRFGMFFLHDLEIRTGTLKELHPEDTPAVLHAYARSLKSLKKKTLTNAQPHKRVTVSDEREFPWGPNPSWTRIQQLLDTEPESFLLQHLNNSWKNPTHVQCELLFIQFTTELWLSLADSFVSAGMLPKPKTLEDAMGTWTVTNIQAVLGETRCRFLASANGLEGKVPSKLRRQPSFLARRSIFFPDPTIQFPEKSIWKPYTENQGYISTYFNYLKEWSTEEVTQLQNDLDNIFSHLQCLPPSTLSGNSIWTASHGRIVFIANPRHYRVKGIGGNTQPTGYNTGPKRPQASVPQLARRLHQQHHMGSNSKIRLQDHRQSKKWRKPPVRKPVDKQPDKTKTRSKTTNIPLAALKNLRSKTSNTKGKQKMGYEDDEGDELEGDEDIEYLDGYCDKDLGNSSAGSGSEGTSSW
jgi:hypothetical protein